jgi:hydroxymethylpyrimidine/phosphomethylpyrimidine kinase
MTLVDAVAKAMEFVTAAIKGSLGIGQGARVLFTGRGD